MIGSIELNGFVAVRVVTLIAGRREADVVAIEHIDDLGEQCQPPARPVERAVRAQIEAAVHRQARRVPHVGDEIPAVTVSA